MSSWSRGGDGAVSSGVRNGVTTEAENLHCVKSVARKRLVETVND
jgi:hypothetical protein